MKVRPTTATLLALLLLLSAGCATENASPPEHRPAMPNPQAPGATRELTLTKVADGLERPLHLTHAGDRSNRLFILEQPGRIRILQDGNLLPEPFLDLTSTVNSARNEQGLLGLAFSPDYAASGQFYLHYTGSQGETVIARYRVAPNSPDRADPDSAEIILTVPQPYANHNGGPILFGPDGYLYIALGDGGSAGDPQNNAQNLESLLGKLLRIDVTGPDGYRIPPDNPLVGKDGRDEIWAYGLRNPWRASFDRETGDLYIADVGQNAIEEINFQPAGSPGGQNYGWRVYEGSAPYQGALLQDAVFPVIEYQHKDGGCSVTGGYVYRGKALPDLVGTYLFGDFCSGLIWGGRQENGEWKATELLKTELRISAFGQDEQGELYVVDHQGAVYRIEP